VAFAETPHGKFFYIQPDLIGQTVAAGAFWEAHLRPYIDVLGEDDVFVDAGANIGFFSVYAGLVRRAKVHAFEASPEIFSLLKRNVEVNCLEELVTVYNVPLYDRETELTLNPLWVDWPKTVEGKIDYERHGNSGGLSLVPGACAIGGYSFASKTLDSFMFQNVKLIKVDTQGSDLRILVGAEETIKRCKPIILFEYEENSSTKVNGSGDSAVDFSRFFDKIGYSAKHLANVDHVAEPK
jgi:FkbM family methyltransferase